MHGHAVGMLEAGIWDSVWIGSQCLDFLHGLRSELVTLAALQLNQDRHTRSM